MRAVNFKMRLERLFEMLNFAPEEERAGNGRKFYIFDNWATTCYALLQLEKFAFIEDVIQQIFAQGVQFQAQTEQLKIDRDQYTRILPMLDKIEVIVAKAIILLDEFFPDDGEDQLNIKLPDNITLAEFSSITKDLDFIFNKCQVISSLNNKDDVIVRKVDSGSMWLILAYSAGALSIIGSLCKIAFDVSQKIQDYRKTEEHIRVLKSGADTVEAMTAELKEKIKSDSRSAAEEFIADNRLATTNGEEIASVAAGIESLAELILKGVEIYASLSAPENVAKSFPAGKETLKLMKETLNLPTRTDRAE